MFFFYGWGTKADKKEVYDQKFCPTCNALVPFHGVIQYDYFSLFFIPIIKWNKRYYMECPYCGNAYSISKETYQQIKEGIAPQTVATPAPVAQAEQAQDPFNGQFDASAAAATTAEAVPVAAMTAETSAASDPIVGESAEADATEQK